MHEEHLVAGTLRATFRFSNEGHYTSQKRLQCTASEKPAPASGPQCELAGRPLGSVATAGSAAASTPRRGNRSCFPVASGTFAFFSHRLLYSKSEANTTQPRSPESRGRGRVPAPSAPGPRPVPSRRPEAEPVSALPSGPVLGSPAWLGAGACPPRPGRVRRFGTVRVRLSRAHSAVTCKRQGGERGR